jgi:hypothetical protein
MLTSKISHAEITQIGNFLFPVRVLKNTTYCNNWHQQIN